MGGLNKFDGDGRFMRRAIVLTSEGDQAGSQHDRLRDRCWTARSLARAIRRWISVTIPTAHAETTAIRIGGMRPRRSQQRFVSKSRGIPMLAECRPDLFGFERAEGHSRISLGYFRSG